MSAAQTAKGSGVFRHNKNRSLISLAAIFADDNTGPINEQSFSEKPDKIESVVILDEDSTYERPLNGIPLVEDIQARPASNLPVKKKGPPNGNTHVQKFEKFPTLNRSVSALKLPAADLDRKRHSLAESISSKYAYRNEELRKTFSGTAGERLICDYSCALERDILIQGRLFISPNFLCFKANLLVWYTELSICFTDISSITKEKTARIIPNAISIVVNGEKHFFTSFATRDKVYDLLLQVWKISSCGQILSSDDVWQLVQQNYKGVAQLTNGDAGEESKEVELKEMNRSAHTPALLLGDDINGGDGDSCLLPSSVIENATFISGLLCQDMPSEIHSHNGKCVLNETYPVSINQLCEMIFTDSPLFAEFAKAQTMKNIQSSQWNANNQQCDSKERIVTYDISVKLPVGMRTSTITEKQTCYLLRVGDSQTVVHVVSECKNKGVPYADAFIVSNHFCISQVAADQVQLMVYSEIIYVQAISGLIKGFLEKNIKQGVASNFSVLNRCLRIESMRQPRPASNNVMHADAGGSKMQSANIAATDAAATVDESQHKSHYVSQNGVLSTSQPSHSYRIFAIFLLMLLLLASGQSIIIYKLLVLEPCASSAMLQDWQTPQDSCGQCETVAVALLEKQQKQHEEDMAVLKSMLEKSLQPAESHLRGHNDAVPFHRSTSNHDSNCNGHCAGAPE